jgi:hypothetical protein
VIPLLADPRSQLGVFARRNIAVPVDSVIFGKLAETVFPCDIYASFNNIFRLDSVLDPRLQFVEECMHVIRRLRV